MKLKILHPHRWDLTLDEAKKIQLELAEKVICKNAIGQVIHVAGIDVGFNLKRNVSKAAIAILSYPDLKLVETTQAEMETIFPYISGFLSFREAPVIIKALKKLIICLM